VNSSRDPQLRFDAVMAEISALPEAQQLDALLQFFTTVLAGLPLAQLRQRRAEMVERFSHCGGGFETCSALLELVDLYVATREKQTSRPGAIARRSPSRAATRRGRNRRSGKLSFRTRPGGQPPHRR
jgi:hypothetical protein